MGSLFCCGTKPVIGRNGKESLAHINQITTIYNYLFCENPLPHPKKQANRLLTHMVAICTLFKWASAKSTMPKMPCPGSGGAGFGNTLSPWTAHKSSSDPHTPATGGVRHRADEENGCLINICQVIIRSRYLSSLHLRAYTNAKCLHLKKSLLLPSTHS